MPIETIHIITERALSPHDVCAHRDAKIDVENDILSRDGSIVTQFALGSLQHIIVADVPEGSKSALPLSKGNPVDRQLYYHTPPKRYMNYLEM